MKLDIKTKATLELVPTRTHFNKVGESIYASEWTLDAMQIWNWEAGNAPRDIGSGERDARFHDWSRESNRFYLKNVK